MSVTFWEDGIVIIQGIYWSWKMTRCFVCNNCNMIIFIQSYNVKEGFRIHTGLRKWNQKDWFHIFLRDNNPLGIKRPCFIIEKNEVLLEQYNIALKQDKDAIDIEGEDERKRNRLFFDFMLRIFDHLNQYMRRKKCFLWIQS